MAASNSSPKGSAPKRCDSATQALTAPGTVTLSQPVTGIVVWRAKRSAVHPAGERPEAFRPVSRSPSQTMAKASLPTPLLHGSTTVNVMAVATAASTALPPRRRMSTPAAAASGWEVATTLRASTGARRDGCGKDQSNTVHRVVDAESRV